MPKGPRGEKRPAVAIGLAVMIGKIVDKIYAMAPDPIKRGPYKERAAAAGATGGRTEGGR